MQRTWDFSVAAAQRMGWLLLWVFSAVVGGLRP